jgi:hypothetical protein
VVTFEEDKVYAQAKPQPLLENPLPAVNPNFSAWEGAPIRVMFIGEFMRAYKAGELTQRGE